ncbi:hypothetical protein LEMLEM_LOCUS14159, partial [Lemmus lemmus]
MCLHIISSTRERRKPVAAGQECHRMIPVCPVHAHVCHLHWLPQRPHSQDTFVPLMKEVIDRVSQRPQ